ncbi:ATP-dependent helicase HrpB [Nanchangia anserum]|uniref:ATP-dependent helicase HrpB n=1 Tax=Nanchangia anserum TaxID=2692125 RepID=A0A8I0GAM6_9ACTO|nr:ATP-dependent helicase HrpB [Nanchangia anserum]QOX82641.1 ATP-dependent helicase HrpB [Nanchangia anserum]
MSRRLRGAGLPVSGRLDDIVARVEDGHRLVVQAPPGSGKTALIPAAIAAWLSERGRPGRVWCTQPRRVAARAAAHYAATLTRTRPGEDIGYTVRGEHRIGTEARVEFCTAGIVTRRLAADPFASGAAAIILDEVHERSLDTDLACALAAEAGRARDDLVVIAMSATLDAERFAQLLGDGRPAPILTVSTATHPLDVTYAPPPRQIVPLDARGVTDGFLSHVATTATREIARADGDVLVIVPGAREVDRVARAIAQANPDYRVDRLHGSLPFREQQRVLDAEPAARPRVVVSTAITESALTIPGIRCVVDSGLARVPRYDHARGMGGLATVLASKAAATQRAGRAAREAPGRAVRCLDEATWPKLAAYPDPEIAVSDLADAVLTLAAWGAPGGVGIDLVDPLPEAARERAVATLRGLGALDEAGALTDVGRRLHDVPVDPRLARALLEGAERVGGRLAGEVVALLSEDARGRGDDLASALTRMRRGEDPQAASWRRQAARLSRYAPTGTQELRGSDALAWVVALAYPERLARRRSTSAQGQRRIGYALASGSGASIAATSHLAGAQWLAIADISRTGGHADASGAVIRQGVPISEELALNAGRHLMTSRVTTTIERGRARSQAVRSLGAIECARVACDPDDASLARAIDEAVARDRIGPGPHAILSWPSSALDLRARLTLLHAAIGEPWPDVSDAQLRANAHEWFALAWQRLRAGRRIPAEASLDALRALLPWPEAARLDELAPTHLELPSGRRAAIDYGADKPCVRAKLQECFGWAETPRIADGHVDVLIDLLDPAGRVLAHTGDLTYFWNNVYPAVRAEKRGRYPKHPWPEDPWTAQPSQRVNPRRR